jgi:hypothetical protein
LVASLDHLGINSDCKSDASTIKGKPSAISPRGNFFNLDNKHSPFKEDLKIKK